MISEVHNEKKLKSYKCIWVNGKLIRLHRYLMEKHLGRKLLPTEIVHHKDGNKHNNDLSNLEITNRSDHARYHMTGIVRPLNGGVKKCVDCGCEKYLSPYTYNNTRQNGKYKCRSCYTLNKKWRVKSK